MIIFKIIFAIILVEAITEIISKSEIFSPVRRFFYEKRNNRVFRFIHDLLDCGYCTSVWVGWFIAFVLFRDLYFFNKYLDLFFIGLVLHRLSNVLHFVIDRINGNDFYDKEDKGSI
jgi:hypothetical protein